MAGNISDGGLAGFEILTGGLCIDLYIEAEVIRMVDMAAVVDSSMERQRAQAVVIMRAVVHIISPFTIIRRVEEVVVDIIRVVVAEQVEDIIKVMWHRLYIRAIPDRIRAANTARQQCLLLHCLHSCFS